MPVCDQQGFWCTRGVSNAEELFEDCPALVSGATTNSLTTIRFGTIPQTAFGDTGVMVCDTNHVPTTGSFSYVCGAGGTWPSIGAVCEPPCAPVSIANSDSDPAPANVNYGDAHTVNCLPGFSLFVSGTASGTSQVFTCDGGSTAPSTTGTYTPVPGTILCRQDCDPQTEVLASGAPEITGSIHGGTGAVSCPSGRTLIGGSSATCADGAWSGQGVCHANCDAQIESGSTPGIAAAPHGSTTAPVTCIAPGSTLDPITAVLATCTDGVFTGQGTCQAACTATNEGDLGPLSPAISGAGHLATGTATCALPSVFSGATDLVLCTAGTFAATGTCLGPCPALTSVDGIGNVGLGGTELGYGTMDAANYGQSSTVNCAQGQSFPLGGPTTYLCAEFPPATGITTWTLGGLPIITPSVTPICAPNCPLPEVENAEWDESNVVAEGQTSTLECLDGFEMAPPDAAPLVGTCNQSLSGIIGKLYMPTEDVTCEEIDEGLPLTAEEELIVDILVTLGCVAIIAANAVTLGIFLFLRDFCVERLIHMGEEICLLIGHILMLTLRDRVGSPQLCKITSIAMQYFFTGVFAFLMLEALQVYAIRTNVTKKGGFLGLNRWLILFMGFAIPVLPTALTAPFGESSLTSDYSCWLNMGHQVSLGTFIPVMGLAMGCVILVEASGMGEFTRMPGTDKAQYSAAMANSKGVFVFLPMNLASWFIAVQAVYYVKVSLYGSVLLINSILAAAVVTFHMLGNPTIHGWVAKFRARLAGHVILPDTQWTQK